MKKLIARIQKDISKLQSTVQKEGNDLLKKIKKLDLKSNLEHTQQELRQVLSDKLKKMEPSYNHFVDELRKNAKKAGIDVDKIEKGLKKTANEAKKKLHIRTKKKARKTRTVKKPSRKATKKAASPSTDTQGGA